MGWNLPPKVEAAFEQLRQPIEQDPLDWARRIVDRFLAGQRVAPLTLQMACQALHIPIPEKPQKEPR